MNYDRLGTNTEISPSRERSLANLRPPWKKGESGNPEGRPPDGIITEVYKEILAEADFRPALKSAVKDRLLAKGVAGFLMSREVADRTEGPIKQQIDMQVTLGLAETLSKARQRIEE